MCAVTKLKPVTSLDYPPESFGASFPASSLSTFLEGRGRQAAREDGRQVVEQPRGDHGLLLEEALEKRTREHQDVRRRACYHRSGATRGGQETDLAEHVASR